MQRMERRKQNRIKTDKFDIEYRFVADDFMTPVSVLNVSETGICFLRQSPINKNDQIELMFPFKDGKIFLRAKKLLQFKSLWRGARVAKGGRL